MTLISAREDRLELSKEGCSKVRLLLYEYVTRLIKRDFA